MRREVADRLTEQLARSGNEQAIAFRPAVILALESVVDTDTFRSIFRDAIRRTHEALLAGRGAGAGLDLSDSLAIVSASLELRASGQGQSSGGGLGQSLADVTQRANALHIWDLEQLVDLAAIVGILGGGLLAALSVALSLDRRRAVVRIGWVLVADGALIVLCLKGARVYAGRRIGGDTLSEAVQGALARGTADLNTVGFWIMGYGIVAAAAAGALGSRATRLTPSVVRTSFAAWVERRRATTAGTVALGVVGLLVGLMFIQDPDANPRDPGRGRRALAELPVGRRAPQPHPAGPRRQRRRRRPRPRRGAARPPARHRHGSRHHRRRGDDGRPRRQHPPGHAAGRGQRASGPATARSIAATWPSTRSSSRAPTTRCRRRCTRAGSSANR